MALKSLLFVCFLVVGLAAVTAKAQLLPSNISAVRIQGTLYCTINGTINSNGTTTPVFAGALVQVQCRPNTVLASTRTDAAGVFMIPVNPVQFLLLSVLTNCNLFVATPLTTCNSSLSTNGTLTSNLRFLESTAAGIITLIPTGFNIQLST